MLMTCLRAMISYFTHGLMLIAEQTEYQKLTCINQANQNALAATSNF